MISITEILQMGPVMPVIVIDDSTLASAATDAGPTNVDNLSRRF